MPTGDARRLFLLAAIAVALGLLFGWYAGIFTDDTPESRLRATAEEIRERVRQFTH